MKTLLIAVVGWLSLATVGYAAMTDNLRAYYKLDESSSDAADATGNGFTLTNTNTVTYTSAKLNNGAVFVSGSSQRLRSTATILSGAKANVSLSLWMNRSSTGHIVAGGCGTNAADRFNVLWFSDATVYFQFAKAYGSVAQSGTGWHHFVIAYDGSQGTNATKLVCYIDGVQKTLSFGGSITTTYTAPADFKLGHEANGYSTGTIDECGLWERTLTSGDVTTLYGSGTPPAYPFSSGGSTVRRQAVVVGSLAHPYQPTDIDWRCSPFAAFFGALAP